MRIHTIVVILGGWMCVNLLAAGVTNTVTLHGNGLHGYIGFNATRPKDQSKYCAGMGFYSAVWPLVDKPIAHFKSKPYKVKLADGSTVTYAWYRFVDQPSFQQYHWDKKKKAKLQALVEKIHASWPINRDYMAPPTSGEVATLDPALLVKPPEGMEIGYVPIVTRQENTH